MNTKKEKGEEYDQPCHLTPDSITAAQTAFLPVHKLVLLTS